MGFSVSGSAALIFIAMFIGFGMFHSATANGFENINDAREDQSDRLLDQQNTEISVTSAVWNENGEKNLTIDVDNTGATELSVNKTDLLVDNSYASGYNTEVDTNDGTNSANSETDIWSPQETLAITVESISEPSNVKIVTENGVADTRAVS